MLQQSFFLESEPNSPFFPRFSNFDTRQSNATTTPTPSNSSSKNNNATHNIFNFSPERTKSPSLKAKMAFQKIRCLTKTAVSSFYETPDSSNNTDSKTGEGEDFQTRPLPPLPTSSEFNLQQKSPFKVHSLFNTSLDEQCQASHGETKTKLKYEELEQYLQRNSSHSDLLYAVDFTSKRKNTVSEFRKHRSTYNKNRRQVVAAQVTRAYLARQRSSSIDERLSQTSLNRKGNLTRRSRSLDDLLDNITVNQIYVDIKTAYETVPDNLRRKQQKPRPKKPPRLFYESYRAQNSFQEMCSPRDGGMTVSTNTLYGTVKGENEYALITDLPEVAKKLNIQKRPMPPTPTLLDMCFMRRSPATEKNSLIKGNVNALRTPITGAVGANPNEDCHYHAPVLLDHSGDVPTGNEDHYHNIRVRRHLSVQFPSFRSNISGSSGAYAKIPDLMAGGGGKDQSWWKCYIVYGSCYIFNCYCRWFPKRCEWFERFKYQIKDSSYNYIISKIKWKNFDQ